MVFNSTEEQEKAYLRKVLDAVQRAIGASGASVGEHVRTLKEHKDYLWSNKDLDAQEVRSMRESILNHLALGEGVIARQKRLAKLLDIPWFGRIDFREEGSGGNPSPVYIGIHAFYDVRSRSHFVFDWRAPVSGMFYDYELGPARYVAPSGEVSGEVSLKRQYRIRRGQMEFMLESALTVHDEILQKELSVRADDKMKNIVATIQREQNRIIRNGEASTLIIQGVAGSGKTSIALHRVAYLLYTNKEDMTAQDILIISPNQVFADYISNVLPELGEEMVPETSMEQICSRVLGGRYRFQNFYEQVAELLGHPKPGFVERVRYKSSFEFVSQLNEFILYTENNFFRAKDVLLTPHLPLPAEFITEQFRRFHRYPMRQRFEVMADYILDIAQAQYGLPVTTANKTMLKKEIRGMFAGNNDLQMYQAFFEWAGCQEMFRMRGRNILEYADLAPMAYLHLALEGNPGQDLVKHLVIDEMQDYAPIQYKVIQKLYPCRKTILGDIGQSVNPYGSSSAEMIQKAFAAAEIMYLHKSYRSTCEITHFAQTIRTDGHIEVVERHGDTPRVWQVGTEAEELGVIKELVAEFRSSQFESLGIICKDESRAWSLYEHLRAESDDVYILSHHNEAFVRGIVVTSAHMSKGLEFDEVIVPYADRRTYRTEMDRGMLYVAVTRALHRLSITCAGELTGFVSPLASEGANNERE